MASADEILSSFADVAGFPDGLALDQNRELTFIVGGVLEIGLAAIEQAPPRFALVSHLGSIREIESEALMLALRANRDEGEIAAKPRAVVLDEPEGLALLLDLPLAGLDAHLFAGALEVFVSTASDLGEALDALRDKTASAAKEAGGDDPNVLIFRS